MKLTDGSWVRGEFAVIEGRAQLAPELDERHMHASRQTQGSGCQSRRVCQQLDIGQSVNCRCIQFLPELS